MSEQEPPSPPEEKPPETADTPPQITDFLQWLVFHLKRDWIMFIKYPVAAFAVCAITLFLCWLLVWQVVVPEKDQQLQTRQDTIENKQSLIDILQTKLQSEEAENANLKNPSTNYYTIPQNYTNTLPSSGIISKSQPEFDLYLNRQYVTNGIVLNLPSDGSLFFEVYNTGTQFATNLTFKFFAPFDPTNFIYDAHWLVDTFSQPIPINHKMYDLSKAFEIQMIAQNAVDWHPMRNGFDLTTFNIITNCELVLDPIERLQQFGKILDTNIRVPVGYYFPIYVEVGSIGSETNGYCIFLNPDAP